MRVPCSAPFATGVPYASRRSPQCRLLLTPAAGILAQGANSLPRHHSRRAGAKGPRVIFLADYGSWNRIVGRHLAGWRWMTYAYQPNDGDVTLFVRQLDGARIDTVQVGSAPQQGGGGGGGFGGGGGQQGPQFSDDSRFVGYYVNPPTPREGSGRGGRAGAPGAQRPGAQGAAGASRPQRRFELLDLASGAKFSVTNPASFRFSNDGQWLAVRVNRPQGDTTRDGGDLVLRELVTGATRNVGNVNLYAFDDAGRLFAYTVDAPERLGNRCLVELATGALRLDGDGRPPARLGDEVTSRYCAATRRKTTSRRERAAGLGRPGHAARKGGRLRSRGGRGLPQGPGGVRVRRAPLERGRHAALFRRQAAGGRARGERRPQGQRGRLALEGHGAPVGADGADQPAAPGDAPGRAPRRHAEVRAAGDDDMRTVQHPERPVGDRPARRAVPRRGRLGRGTGGLLPGEYRDRRAYPDRAGAVPHHGHVARQPVVPLPQGGPRLRYNLGRLAPSTRPPA
jgi:hypothetical protein